MAHAVGFSCDVCKTFQLGEKEQFPKGWLKLTVPNTGQGVREGGIDVCSDKCLLKLARERWIANRPQGGRSYKKRTPEEIAALEGGRSPDSRGVRKMHHNRRHVDGVTSVHCEFCL